MTIPISISKSVIGDINRYYDVDLVNNMLGKIRVNDNGCWEWTGARHMDGYGVVYSYKNKKQKQFLAHRVMAGVMFSPKTQEVDHDCENRICINPSHLTVRDRLSHKRRHAGWLDTDPGKCPRGHQLIPRTDSNKSYPCQVCLREKWARRYAKRAERMRDDPEYREDQLRRSRIACAKWAAKRKRNKPPKVEVL